MFKKFGKISFDFSFLLCIGFSLAGLIATFMSIFITWTTTWDAFFEALGTAFTAVALSRSHLYCHRVCLRSRVEQVKTMLTVEIIQTDIKEAMRVIR